MTTRWIFHDPVADESWTMPINPDSMTSPEPTKNLRYGLGRVTDQADDSGVDNKRTVTFLGKPQGQDWQFGGAIRTQAHFQSLSDWVAKTNEVQITDHLGRTYSVYLTAFKPQEGRASRTTPWHQRYTITAKILERVS